MPARDLTIETTKPEGCLVLSGPSVEVEEGHLPVRGDLAHIKLAGRFFVPHYAVPMAHRTKAQATRLRQSAKPDADTVMELATGTRFDVLDIAGGWAWGQVCEPEYGEDGPVGYIVLDELEQVGP